MWNGLPTLIWGTGDTSREVVEIIEAINSKNLQPVYNILGFVSEHNDEIGKTLSGLEVVSSDDSVFDYIKSMNIVGAVIPFQNGLIKKKLHELLSEHSQVVFPNIIHPSVSFKAQKNEIGEGNVIYPHVSMTTNIKLGDLNTINMNTTIGHDVSIGSYNAIHPGCSLSGCVQVGDYVVIGTRSAITQGLKVASNAFIAAGSVVIEGVKETQKVSGNFATNHMDRLQSYAKVKRNEKRRILEK